MNLVYSPRWGDSTHLLDWGPWALAGLVPAALIVWLYRYELKLISKLAAALLLGLRFVLLALLVFLVLWQPRLPVQAAEKFTNRILVIVDRTGSMNVKDPTRQPLEKLQLARALRLGRDSCSEKELDRWIEDLTKDAKREPRWLTEEEQANSSEATRKLLEHQGRDRFDKLCAHIDGCTRSQLVGHLLAEGHGDFLRELGGRFQVQLLTFAQDVEEPTAKQLLDALDLSDKKRDGAFAAERGYTAFTPVLQAALKRVTEANGTIRGVIFITDGRMNRGDKPLDIAARLGELKAPLYPVVVGSREPRPAEIAIARLEAPSTLLKDPDDAKNLNAVIKARVQVKGIKAKSLDVELRDGQKLLGRRTILISGTKPFYDVEFPTALNEEGTHGLRLRVLPPDGYKDREGLEKTAKTQVIRDQAQVLVIDGEARWEYHYLTVALGRDPLVKEVRGVVFDQPRIEKVRETDLKKLNWPALELPAEKAGLTGYDCIVLGDVPPENLPLAERKRLQSYVRDTGGTLVIVAGKRAMPLVYVNEGPRTKDNTDPIAAMLPVLEPHVINSRQGFRVTLTREGERNQLLQLSDKASDDEVVVDAKPRRQIWSELPAHYWAVVGKKKPAANTLAFYPGEPDDPTADKMTESDQEERSLIAWQSYGRGRVLYVGLDSTWRWRYKVGDRHHHRFWGQLVRWATADKLLPGGAGKVRYGTPRPDYKMGDEVDLRVRLDHSLPEPPADASVVANVLRVEGDKTEKVAAVVLTPRRPATGTGDKKPQSDQGDAGSEGNPRVFEGKGRDLPPGSYKIELDFGALAKTLGDAVDLDAVKKHAAEFSVETPLSDEMANVTPDVELLQNLADKSGSRKVYTLDTAREIIDNVERKEEAVIEAPPKPLWEWWPTLVVILGLLTMEWVGRKWAGLP
jgi:hypothetical protein